MSTRALIMLIANALPWIILAIRANVWADDHEKRITRIENSYCTCDWPNKHERNVG